MIFNFKTLYDFSVSSLLIILSVERNVENNWNVVMNVQKNALNAKKLLCRSQEEFDVIILIV